MKRCQGRFLERLGSRIEGWGEFQQAEVGMEGQTVLVFILVKENSRVTFTAESFLEDEVAVRSFWGFFMALWFDDQTPLCSMCSK